MAARAGIVLVALVAGLAGPVSDTVARPSTSLARVERVVDGDTVVLAGARGFGWSRSTRRSPGRPSATRAPRDATFAGCSPPGLS